MVIEMQPQMKSSWILAKSRARNYADPSCLQQIESVENIRILSIGFRCRNSFLRNFDLENQEPMNLWN